MAEPRHIPSHQVRGRRAEDGSPAASARRGLAVFFAVLIPLSVVGYYVNIATGNPLILMVTPALASVVARLVRREGWSDVSLRFGPVRRTLPVLAVVYCAALAYGTIPPLLGWSLRLIPFEVPRAADGTQNLLLLLLLNMTINPLLGCVMVMGEELGWRGYLLTRLITAGAPRPLLAHALIWATWHLPLILAGVYDSAGTHHLGRVVPLFLITTGALSYILAWARLRTGSIWPGAVGHSVANFAGQSFAIASVPGDPARLWVGEAGLLSAAVLVICAAILWRRYRPPVLHRTTRSELAPDRVAVP
jgi:membrane protease YdiL (CAAX protease family)